MLTTQSSPPAPQAISWIWMLPVTWHERGRKQASCRPGGSSLAVTAGTSTNSQTWIVGADGQAVAVEGHAHRGLEDAEVGVEVVPLVADHHELAGLVGGDQQRRAELPQERGEVRRVDGPQGCCLSVGLGVVGCRRQFGGGSRHRQDFHDLRLISNQLFQSRIRY